MTGGSLPAQTWRDIMAYAHQGIELKGIPGLSPQAPTVARNQVAESRGSNDGPQRPSILTRRGADVLVRVERLMDDATRALAVRDVPGNKADAQDATPQRRGAFASAGDREPPATVRGN
jgi:penicillin-binding protein 1A